MKTDTVILGGGLAGLAAAVELVRSGRKIILVEARRQMGGRAYSFHDNPSGTMLDNGQHLLMGCYAATLKYLEIIGAQDACLRRTPLKIPFRHADGRSSSLTAGSLPYPLNLAQAFCGFAFLSISDRLSVTRFAASLLFNRNNSEAGLDALSVEEWLTAKKQSPALMEFLWRPIVLATMNAEPAEASAKVFLAVLKKVFLSGNAGSELLLPNCGLSELFVDRASEYILKNGSTVLTHSPVRSLTAEGDRITAVHLNDAVIEADSVISALPAGALSAVLGQSELEHLVRCDAEKFQSSAIVSFHIWTDKLLTDAPMTGLLGTHLQWIFFKGATADGGFRYSCTISAANTIAAQSHDDLARMAADELCTVFPHISRDNIRRVLVIRERNATFIPAPGMEQFRPLCRTEYSNLFLAGDWTNTGFPATIEGAIRSGFAAASASLVH